MSRNLEAEVRVLRRLFAFRPMGMLAWCLPEGTPMAEPVQPTLKTATADSVVLEVEPRLRLPVGERVTALIRSPQVRVPNTWLCTPTDFGRPSSTLGFTFQGLGKPIHRGGVVTEVDLRQWQFEAQLGQHEPLRNLPHLCNQLRQRGALEDAWIADLIESAVLRHWYLPSLLSYTTH